MSSDAGLQEWVADAAARLDVPGVAVGIYHAGDEHYACHGVTSVENPLPVNAETLFQFGSTTKTFTATAIMCLVDRGQVDLDATVRTYLPELTLQDDNVANNVTIIHLLNHTAGWCGDVFDSTGDGDDTLVRFVELMSTVNQDAPLGTVSYNNASLSIAGRIIEKVTGITYERAIQQLIFEPLGLDHCYFFPNDIMTRRFVVGHNRHPDGTTTVARPWAMPRSVNPAGGIASNAADLITWARFHLGHVQTVDGTELLPAALITQMQTATVTTPGSGIGDAIGITWQLRDIDGVRVVGHGGDTIGQHSSFELIPAHDFALIGLTNCGPNGNQLLNELTRWAFATYAGVIHHDPQPITLGTDELADYAGTYETSSAEIAISFDPDGDGLLLTVEMKPEELAKLMETGEEPPDVIPVPIGILPGPGDRYIVTDGSSKGGKGYFGRGADGAVESLHISGRHATRTAVARHP